MRRAVALLLCLVSVAALADVTLVYLTSQTQILPVAVIRRQPGGTYTCDGTCRTATAGGQYPRTCAVAITAPAATPGACLTALAALCTPSACITVD